MTVTSVRTLPRLELCDKLSGHSVRRRLAADSHCSVCSLCRQDALNCGSISLIHRMFLFGVARFLEYPALRLSPSIVCFTVVVLYKTWSVLGPFCYLYIC